MNKQIKEIAKVIFDYVDSKTGKNEIEEMVRDLPFLTLEREVHISSTNVEKRAWTLSEEDNKIIAEALYNAGYRKVPDGEVTLSPEERDFVMKTITDIRAERDELKAENERLSEKFKQVLLSIDTVKEMNAMCNIDEHRKQAVREFAEKIKTQVYPFLQAKLFNEKCYLTGNPESDIYREQKNQNIGILKAQDVLSQWFNIKIDELLKENE